MYKVMIEYQKDTFEWQEPPEKKMNLRAFKDNQEKLKKKMA